VATRAFRLEEATFRIEVQRAGDSLAAVPGATLPSLDAAWQHAESIAISLFPHDCRSTRCGEPQQRD
jgi:hypothetical protein